MQPSSRSRHSPRRSPERRSSRIAERANRSSRRAAAAIRAASASGASARGSGRGRRGTSLAKIEPALGLVGPSPQGDVVEEVPDGQHGAVHGRGRDALVAGDPAAPGPGPVPGKEGFDVVAFELGDRGDGRELLTEERPERDEVVDQPVRRGPRQHRGPGLHITGHGAPDAVSRDDRQAFLGRGTRRAALGRLRELTALEQQLAQAEQPPVPLLERGSRRAGDLTEGGGEAVEYLRHRSRGSWSGTRR